jgi:protein-S-isoprenylcysteine O-methyltransferase Ste14
MTTPLPFQWPWLLVFWLAFIWAYTPEFAIVRRANREETATDSRSLRVILIGQSLASFFGFFVSPTSVWRIAPAHEAPVFLLGVVVLVAGSLLRRHCWRMLGESFTGDVRASADQKVIDRGAYRFLRHPSYTAGLLLNLGVGLALGNWMSVGLFVLGTYATYAYRIRVEERALLTVIGEPYRQFMATRKRLIPFVY